MRAEDTLIDVLSTVERNPEQGLTDLRVMAERWELPEIAEWARKECSGYGLTEDLPNYRVWEARLVGDLHGTWSSEVAKELDLREVIRSSPTAARVATTYRCTRAIGWLWNESYGGMGQKEARMPVTRELEDLVTAEMGMSIVPRPAQVRCVRAEHRFGTSEFGAAAQGARQWALDLCIACEDKGLVLPNPRGSNGKRKEQQKGEAKMVQRIWDELKEHKWEIISIGVGLGGIVA